MSLGILMSDAYSSQRIPMLFNLVFVGSGTCYGAGGPCVQTADALARVLRTGATPANIWWILSGPNANMVPSEHPTTLSAPLTFVKF